LSPQASFSTSAIIAPPYVRLPLHDIAATALLPPPLATVALSEPGCGRRQEQLTLSLIAKVTS